MLRNATPELTSRLDSGSLVCESPAYVGVSSLVIFGVEIEASASHKHQETSLTSTQGTNHHYHILSLSRFIFNYE